MFGLNCASEYLKYLHTPSKMGHSRTPGPSWDRGQNETGSWIAEQWHTPHQVLPSLKELETLQDAFEKYHISPTLCQADTSSTCH